MTTTARLLAILPALTLLASALPASAQMPAPLPPEALKEEADPAKVAWLRAHEVASGPVRGGLTFRLPAAFYRSKLILLGESHGSAAPQVLDLELLTHLNRRMGLRDYLAEVDPVQAAHLNRFLDTGEEAPLLRVFAFWKPDAQWGNTAFLAKVRAIRALNATLAPARRVRIHGVDRTQDWPLLAEWAKAQGAALDPAALAAAPTDSAQAEAALAALASAPSSPVLEQVRAGLELTRAKTGRERTIFENYRRLVRVGALGDRPAYGLWGLAHVMQAGINGQTYFAMQVKSSDLPAAHALTSLVVLSLDSAVMVPAPLPSGVVKIRLTNFNVDGPLVKAPGSASLRAATRPDTISLFDLSAKGSPYRTAPDLIAVRTSPGINQDFKPDDPKAPATAYAQYVGVFRGSDWAPPLP